jgi:flagellar hook-associated protein FlgK
MVSRWEKGSDVWACTQRENEADRWAPRGSGFSKLKTLLNENSSKQIARSLEKFQENLWM